MNLHPNLRSFADSNRFSLRTVLYLAPSIFPSTLTSFPVSAEEKHPHIIMQSPPSFREDDLLRVLYNIRFPPHVTFCIKLEFCYHLIRVPASTNFLFLLHGFWQTENRTSYGFLLATLPLRPDLSTTNSCLVDKFPN